jgi:hypothetical protein
MRRSHNLVEWYPEQRLKDALRYRFIKPKEWADYEDMRHRNVWTNWPMTQRQLKYKKAIEAMVDNVQVRLRLMANIYESNKPNISMSLPPRNGWDKESKIVSRGNANLTTAKEQQGQTQIVYIARFDEGSWPSDSDLYSLCGGEPYRPSNLGGTYYEITPTLRRVVVCTD